jgi:hypothetical protein
LGGGVGHPVKNGIRGSAKPASTATSFSAARTTASNGNVNSKSVLSTKVNETGSDVPVEPEDLFEMAHLYPSTTGLPMTVWVSPRGNAQHDVRVRGNVTDGDQTDIVNERRRGSLNTSRRRGPAFFCRCDTDDNHTSLGEPR